MDHMAAASADSSVSEQSEQAPTVACLSFASKVQIEQLLHKSDLPALTNVLANFKYLSIYQY